MLSRLARVELEYATGQGPKWDNMVTVAGDALPPEMAALTERFLAALLRLQEWITAPPRTIVQGDFRIDTSSSASRGTRRRSRSATGRRRFSARARTTSPTSSAKAWPRTCGVEHERELVALWHAGLVEGGVTTTAPSRRPEDYRRAVLVLWTYVTVIAGILDPSNERGKAWIVEMVRRASATILDLKIINLLPEFE
jgi:hypothetical protein